MIISLLISLLVGFIASKLLKAKGKWWIYIIIGLVGGAVGGLIFGILGIKSTSIIGDLVSGVVGSVVTILLYRAIAKK